jgi:hypothetical protein
MKLKFHPIQIKKVVTLFTSISPLHLHKERYLLFMEFIIPKGSTYHNSMGPKDYIFNAFLDYIIYL